MDKTAFQPSNEQRPNVRADVFANGAHLHITDGKGQFIGMLTYHVRDPSCMPALIQAMAVWCTHQAQQIQAVMGAQAQMAATEAANGHGA